MIVKTEEEMCVKTSGFIVWSLTQDHSWWTSACALGMAYC